MTCFFFRLDQPILLLKCISWTEFCYVLLEGFKGFELLSSCLLVGLQLNNQNCNIKVQQFRTLGPSEPSFQA